MRVLADVFDIVILYVPFLLQPCPLGLYVCIINLYHHDDLLFKRALSVSLTWKVSDPNENIRIYFKN